MIIAHVCSRKSSFILDLFISVLALQTASLVDLKIVNNHVRLDLIRPIDSFDHVEVICPVESPQIIFNNTQLQTSVDCSFLSNTPLMNFVILTVKQGFNSGVLSISREGNSKSDLSHHRICMFLVPLPIPFTHSLNGRLLTVIGNPPPTMNTPSTYEFQLFIHDPINDQIIFERNKVSDLNPELSITLNYALVPNRKHTIMFKHIVSSIGYAQSGQLLSLSNPWKD